MTTFSEITRTSTTTTAIEDFEHKLKEAQRFSALSTSQDNVPRRFVLASRVSDWFRSAPRDGTDDSTNAARVLSAVLGPNAQPNERHLLLRTMDRDDNLCWLRVFTILLQIKYEGENMGKYITRFYNRPVVDRHLGHKYIHSDVANIFYGIELVKYRSDAEKLATEFCSLQWELCTGSVFDGARNREWEYDCTIIPITNMIPLKEGGTGKVFIVEVPRECIPKRLEDRMSLKLYTRFNDDGTPEGEVQQFALKVLNRLEHYDAERQAYEALAGKDGIVRCHGSWQLELIPSSAHRTQLKEYHLLLECGAFDLTEFFRVYPSPSTAEGILRVWEALCHVVTALATIHRLETLDHDYKTYRGWHCDIKPANIIYCQGEKHGGWKIADPGFATFVQENKVREENGLPVIQIKGGTSTYGGPERSGAGTTRVSQRFDIWSLGCVFSEAATWIALGQRGIQLYQHIRRSGQLNEDDDIEGADQVDKETWEDEVANISYLPANIRGVDRFHDGSKMSDTVAEWHHYVRQSLRSCDPVTKQILDVVEGKMMRADPKERLPAEQLSTIIDSCLALARKDVEKGVEKGTIYRTPSYFRHSKKLEQDQESRAIQDRMFNEAPEKLRDKYKSRAFIKATREPLRDSSEDFSPTPFKDLDNIGFDSNPPHTLRSSKTTPTTLHHNSGIIFSDRGHVMSRSPANQNPVDIDFIDYMGARKLLEDHGWRPGVLEIPQDLVYDGTSGSPISPNSPIQARLISVMSSPQTFSTPEDARTNKPSSKNSFLRKFFGSSAKRKLSDATMSPTGTQSRPGPTATQRARDESEQSIQSHRYEKFDSYFKHRDIVFLMDNDTSMSNHWIYARDILTVLSALLYGQDDDGIDLYFSSCRTAVARNLREPREFIEEMFRFQPKSSASHKEANTEIQAHAETSHIKLPEFSKSTISRSGTSSTASTSDHHEHMCSISDVLDGILTDWSANFHKKKRKLTLIVFTDGVWSRLGNKSSVRTGIYHALESANDKSALRKQLRTRGLSIQFVRFGFDPEAIKELDQMDNELTLADHNGIILPDIIDHESASGNIYKMILGSLDSRYDEDTGTIVGEGEDDYHTLDIQTEPEEYDNGYEPGGSGTSSVPRSPSKRSTISKYIAEGGSQFDRPRQAKTMGPVPASMRFQLPQ